MCQSTGGQKMINEMKDIRTVMPNKEELDAETFLKKEGLRMMTWEVSIITEVE